MLNFAYVFSLWEVADDRYWSNYTYRKCRRQYHRHSYNTVKHSGKHDSLKLCRVHVFPTFFIQFSHFSFSFFKFQFKFSSLCQMKFLFLPILTLSSTQIGVKLVISCPQLILASRMCVSCISISVAVEDDDVLMLWIFSLRRYPSRQSPVASRFT